MYGRKASSRNLVRVAGTAATKGRWLRMLSYCAAAGIVLGYVFMGSMHSVIPPARPAPVLPRLGQPHDHPPHPPHPLCMAVLQVLEVGDDRRHGHETNVIRPRQVVKEGFEDEKWATAAAEEQQREMEQAVAAVKKAAARKQAAAWPTTGDTVHVLATSNGSPYTYVSWVWGPHGSSTSSRRQASLIAYGAACPTDSQHLQQLYGAVGHPQRQAGYVLPSLLLGCGAPEDTAFAPATPPSPLSPSPGCARLAGTSRIGSCMPPGSSHRPSQEGTRW